MIRAGRACSSSSRSSSAQHGRRRVGTGNLAMAISTVEDKASRGSGSRPSQAPGAVRSVDRALAILTSLGRRELTLTEISKSLRLHKTTVTRLLGSLLAADMVSRDERGRYGVGPAVALLAARVGSSHRSLVDFLREPLRRIRDLTKETVVVGVRVGSGWVAIEEMESPQAIKYRAGLARRVPLHVGSAGRTLLAFLPDDEQRYLLKTLRLVRVTDRTVSNRRALARSLAKVRRDGYALSFGEGIVGAASVSLPVFDVTGRMVAVISVLGPESRLSTDRLHRYAAIVRREIPTAPVLVSGG